MNVVERMVQGINQKLVSQGSLFRLYVTKSQTKARHYNLNRLRPDGQKIFISLDQKFLYSGDRKTMLNYLMGFGDSLTFND